MKACGTPVICSNTSSLPELAGDPSAGSEQAAALLVDPTDTSALTAAMRRMLSEPELRQELIEKGYAQIQKFSWATAAKEVLAVLEETAEPDV
jgi:glycosyltransferase involved in cell wall biosynthesis